jgi:hypothetical protein
MQSGLMNFLAEKSSRDVISVSAKGNFVRSSLPRAFWRKSQHGKEPLERVRMTAAPASQNYDSIGS